MRALRYHGIKDLRVDNDVPEPRCGENQVKIKRESYPMDLLVLRRHWKRRGYKLDLGVKQGLWRAFARSEADRSLQRPSAVFVEPTVSQPARILDIVRLPSIFIWSWDILSREATAETPHMCSPSLRSVSECSPQPTGTRALNLHCLLATSARILLTYLHPPRIGTAPIDKRNRTRHHRPRVQRRSRRDRIRRQVPGFQGWG
jgi:hypothetical protein